MKNTKPSQKFLPIFIKVEPNPGGLAECDYEDCSKNPEYINKQGQIRAGTLRARIGQYYYCKDCIPKVHKDLLDLIKKELDPKFWAFK